MKTPSINENEELKKKKIVLVVFYGHEIVYNALD